jgi:uncharacterized protein DUF4956
MTQPHNPMSSGRGLGRVLFYYVVIVAVVLVLAKNFPAVADAISGQRLQELSAADIFGGGAPAAIGDPVATSSTWGGALLALVSMVGALAIMLPVTWVYMVTRRHRGYHESVVHTLLILPVAVTGIVMIVQDSVALAFSLAGIVAAVRFRTTLEDTKDAVYVFLAIGVGLASGVQALGIAFVLSVVFNLVVLALWRTQFGNIYADTNARSGPLALGDVLAGPASGASALRVGDPAILDAAAPGDLSEIADRAVRMERYIAQERAKKKDERANALILANGPGAESAQGYVDELLGELAMRFKLIEIVPVEGKGALLHYLARLDGPAVEGAVIDRLQNSPDGVITSAELRSLKGLKKR